MGGKRTYETIASRVDFSAILLLPVSALIGFATVIAAAIIDRPAPRLIWPCAFSTIAAALVLLRFSEASEWGLWVFTLFGLAFSAAVGTVIGAAIARLLLSAIRSLRGSR
jgi:hypothetical protein